jgi:Calcineurin-like phosphoesterase.
MGKTKILAFIMCTCAYGSAPIQEPQQVNPQCKICTDNVSIIPYIVYDGNFAHEIGEQAKFLYPGQLTIASFDTNHWEYVIIADEPNPNSPVVLAHKCKEHLHEHITKNRILALKTFWQWTSQPYPPRECMQHTWQTFLKTHVTDRLNPFYQITIVPNNGKIHAISDLHGDGRSLINLLKTLHWQNIIDMNGIIKPEHYLIFLGDYSDRGQQSAHVWHILMKLKLLNTGNVFIIRGNHETLQIACDTFLSEWYQYFGYTQGIFEQAPTLSRLFESLPQAVIIGVPATPHDSIIEHYKFLLFCHGGIDPTVSFNRAICKTIASYKKTGHFETQEFQLDLSSFTPSGLMWSDFHANNTQGEEALSLPSVRGGDVRTFNTAAAWEYLENHSSNHPAHTYSLDAIIRGHQHLPNGINRLLSVKTNDQSWQPLATDVPHTNYGPNVYTCTSSPEALGNDCRQDSMLTVEYRQAGFWQLMPQIQDCVREKDS